MAGLHSSTKLSPSASSLLLLSLLLLSLAAFTFFLQWRDEIGDPQFRLPLNRLEYSVMDTTTSFTATTHLPSNCVDTLGQSRSISFPYFRHWKLSYKSDRAPKIGITSSTSAGLEQILPWIYYHKVIGVTNFFLFVEGEAASPAVSKVLESIPNVKLVHRTTKLEEEQAKSRMWNETSMSSYFYKPCNYELFVKQYLNMEMAIVMAKEAHMEWILHLDTDELIHPAGTHDYSLKTLLSDVPENVDMESCVEQDDIQKPFSEVSMFKKNFDHLMEETYYESYKESIRDNPNYFLTYANGKSAARIQEHLRPNGAHRWYNYMKIPTEAKFDEAAVLHYTYAKFSDLTSRRSRCGCKPTKEEVKRCFFLPFDRDAYIIASSATEEEMLNWYRKHVVWTDKHLNKKLIKEGILTRIYAPMVIMQELKETGVYASLINSVQTSLSNDTFLSHNEIVISNSSKAIDAAVRVFSRKIGKKESQMAVRNVLEVVDTGLLAMPPLPSAVMEVSF